MKKRYLSVVAAALLAVSPVAAGVVGLTNPPTEVKAATSLTSDQLMKDYYDSAEAELDGDRLLKLTKTTPYLTAYTGQTVASLAKERIKDVTSNYGHVSSKLDTFIYPANDDGRPEFNSILSKNKTLKKNENYVAALRFEVSAIPPIPHPGYDTEYAYYSIDSDGKSELNKNRTGQDYAVVAILVPVHVNGTKSASTTFSARGYVNTRKRNSKVRTYTSTGKFSKHYVYGQHTYRLNQKKNIKGQGLCYKISGKNQWIQSKYILFR